MPAHRSPASAERRLVQVLEELRDRLEDRGGAVIAELLLGPAAGEDADRREARLRAASMSQRESPIITPSRVPAFSSAASIGSGCGFVRSTSSLLVQPSRKSRASSLSTKRSRSSSLDELAMTTSSPRFFSSASSSRAPSSGSHSSRSRSNSSSCASRRSSPSAPRPRRPRPPPRTGRRPSRCGGGAATPGGRSRTGETRETTRARAGSSRRRACRRGPASAARATTLAAPIFSVRPECTPSWNSSTSFAQNAGQVVRLARRDEPVVDDDLLVDPVAAGVADVGLERRPRRELPAAHDVGLDEHPRAVADHRHGLPAS